MWNMIKEINAIQIEKFPINDTILIAEQLEDLFRPLNDGQKKREVEVAGFRTETMDRQSCL